VPRRRSGRPTVVKGGLQAAAVSGGTPRTIAQISGNRLTTGGTWSPSGIVLAAGGRLVAVPAGGGSVTTLRERDDSGAWDLFGFPHFLPDGRRFLFVTYRGLAPIAVYLSSLDEPAAATKIMDGGSNVQFADGHLLFMRGTALVAQPFDPDTGRLNGEPVTLDESLMPNIAAPYGGAFSVSRTGALVYQQVQPGAGGTSSRLVWRTRAGDQQPLLAEIGNYRSVAVARTGARAIVGRVGVQGQSDLWLVDLTRAVQTRFTFGLSNTGVFAPDGREVVYNAGREGRLDLFRRRLEVGADEQRVPAGDQDWPRTPLSVSPDGKVLLFGAAHPTTGNDLWQIRLDGSSPATPVLASEFEERWGAFSPDGNWIVYESDASGRREIYVRAFDGGGTLTQVSPDGGTYPRWSRNGEEIYFVSAGKLHAASVRSSAAGLEVTAVAPLFDAAPPSGFRRLFYDVAPDGRFLMITDTEAPGPTQVTLALNWSALARGTQ
jgi:eukaryotic-like serine/threonine-protein kinase